MGMLGNQLAAGQALTVANDSFNGDGSTTAFTLSQTVSSVNDIEVLVDNVQQSPYDSSYSVSGTTLTFSGAPSAGTNNVYVIYNASRHITTQQVIPDNGSVTHSKFHTTALNPITLDQSNNRVGIGITNPSVDLEVSNSGNSFLLVKNTSSGSGLYIKADTDGDAELQTAGGSNTLGFRTSGSERMKINSSGYITHSVQPGFSVRQLAQSGIDCQNSSYIAFRNLHTTHFNTGNHFSSTTGMFTAPVDGNYIFGTTFRYDAFSGSYFYVSIYKNGGTFYARDLKQQTGAYLHASVHTIMNMSANDTANVVLNSSGDTSINIDHDCNFYGYLLG